MPILKSVHEVLNDDMLRHILSFLTIKDLLQLNITSKSARVCQLSNEDNFWYHFYLETIQNFITSSKLTNSFDIFEAKFEVLESVCENYKKTLLEFLESLMKPAQQVESELISFVEKVNETPKNDFYLKKEEINSYTPSSFNSSKTFKIAGVGDDSVGKTSLFITVSSGAFPTEYIPIVYDNYSLTFPKSGYVMGYFDTSNLEDYGKLRHLIYPQSDLILVFFSCISSNSFKNVADIFIPEVRQHINDPTIVLVCTKCDFKLTPSMRRAHILNTKEKPISFELGEKLAKKLGCYTYLEVSAKENEGLDNFEAFLAKAILSRQDKLFMSKKKCSLM